MVACRDRGSVVDIWRPSNELNAVVSETERREVSSVLSVGTVCGRGGRENVSAGGLSSFSQLSRSERNLSDHKLGLVGKAGAEVYRAN